jgi:N-methylhydantoinase A
MTGYRIAADIGGTFTDIACLSPTGELATCKLPSTPDDYARAIVEGIGRIARDLGLEPDAFVEVLHASTIATNAILEGKGARTALITTAGFRDVLELRRIRVPRLYEPLYQKPTPLALRRDRHEVAERMGPRGEVIVPLDVAATEALAERLAASDIEAVAVCFLHSYANPAHEIAVADILRAALPGRFLSISHEVLPEIREYERTSTTVVNAYVGPLVSRYLEALRERLAEAGIEGRLLMMQSSGGLLDVAQVIAKPATVIESGPAAGVVGAARLGTVAGHGDVITFDMGGTTAKASLIEGGRLVATDEYEVGGGISLSSALAKGGGYALKLPVIDVSEVGAGGGSIVRIDAGGALKVGPQSAGASPGPACYGAGGSEPTVTDANVVLGYLNPDALAGGSVPIDAGLSRAAIERKVSSPLGRDLLETAYGIHRLANSTMMRAVKAVSTYRGRDPRDFSLFAFGGNGGVHAAALAAELGITRVIVPPGAGAFSAVGLLFTDHEVARTATWMRPIEDGGGERLAALEAQVLAEMGGGDDVTIRWRADLRYQGQGFELGVDVPRAANDAALAAALRTGFEEEHRRSYGHILPGHGIEVVTLRVVGTRPPQGARQLGHARIVPAAPGAPERMAYFGPGHGLIRTPVLTREALGPEPRPGPLIVEEYEGTTVVPPGTAALRDEYGNIVITLPREMA